MGMQRMFSASVFLIILLVDSLLECLGNKVPLDIQKNLLLTRQVSNRSQSFNGSGNAALTINDIFVTVRTSVYFQYSRLPLILKTWYQMAKESVWFLTDTDKRMHQYLTNGHMINTNCSITHNMSDLCCKTNVGYDRFLESGKKWWCRFDDDNYVNIPRLVEILQKYDYMKYWYIGRSHLGHAWKPGIKRPFEMWYATGGAGYCISKSLALKMIPFASKGKFLRNCLDFNLTEDLAMGYLLEQKLNVKLTFLTEFHSHLENLKSIEPETFKDQISFGYSKILYDYNVIKVPGGFHGKYDPTRFLSLHCYLFPNVKFCLN